MQIDLIRDESFKNHVNGTLSVNGVYFCDTMERAYDSAPKLPDGSYDCVRGWHRLKNGPIDTFEVMNVPGHTGILFHPGNTFKSSEGCILVGVLISESQLRHSREVFESFMRELNDLDHFELIVHDV